MARVAVKVTSRPRYNMTASQAMMNVRKNVAKAGLLVQNTAKTNIQQGQPRSGRLRKDGTRSSAVDEFPKSDTGNLANNIFLNFDADGLGVAVESRMEYSAWLEFGTEKMGKRPFLLPSLRMNRDKINALLRSVL
jgi:HK97 gp10 family phage protein|tara:strand:+ start:2663 stop:3067 length:405 start_codon:yes stop_codon:yes gene_type:complete